ncbi:SA1362 family protein [Lentibacillus sp. L22]|uniref:SA1362 family protein n=1 Tax=Lentibacillus TaxID=175304 RepID=UPI0022B16F9F|nr:SA1362 family protein [Lentibacillus daqui]
MIRNKFSVFVYVIIGLAVIGLFSQLFNNTAHFFGRIFTMLGVSIAIFAVIYFVFLKKRAPSSDMKKYKQAVKQSKAKYKTNNKKSVRQKSPQPLNMKKKATKRATHLRVIDGNGNKQKRKNRASF